MLAMRAARLLFSQTSLNPRARPCAFTCDAISRNALRMVGKSIRGLWNATVQFRVEIAN